MNTNGKLREENLSLIIQGRISKVTEICLKSVIKNFPKINQIIISTWEENKSFANNLAKVNQSKIKVIITKDPGILYRKLDGKTPHNVNRIIKSSLNGVKNSESKYSLLIRGDIFFKNNKIINQYNKYNKKNNLLVINTTTIDPERGPKLLYHCCDWLILGKTDNLINYFSIPYMPSEYSNWYESRTKPENKIDPGSLSRFMSEDYITANGLKNLDYKVNHNFYCEYTDLERNKWLKILGKLYIVLPEKKIGLKNLKYENIGFYHFHKSISFIKWKKLENYKVSFIEEFYDNFYFLIRLVFFKIFLKIQFIKKFLKSFF